MNGSKRSGFFFPGSVKESKIHLTEEILEYFFSLVIFAKTISLDCITLWCLCEILRVH